MYEPKHTPLAHKRLAMRLVRQAVKWEAAMRVGLRHASPEHRLAAEAALRRAEQETAAAWAYAHRMDAAR